jgi:hypothetical protein
LSEGFATADVSVALRVEDPEEIEQEAGRRSRPYDFIGFYRQLRLQVAANQGR